MKNNYYSRKRKEVLDYLGGKCMECGFSDYRALQIDHVNNNGYLERKNDKRMVRPFVHLIRDRIKQYQILCANCNQIKRKEREKKRKENFL